MTVFKIDASSCGRSKRPEGSRRAGQPSSRADDQPSNEKSVSFRSMAGGD